MISSDTRRVAGVHSLVGAVIRQAVLDYKTGYEESTGEYPAYLFLHNAGLLSHVDNLYTAILTSNPESYRESRKVVI